MYSQEYQKQIGSVQGETVYDTPTAQKCYTRMCGALICKLVQRMTVPLKGREY